MRALTKMKADSKSHSLRKLVLYPCTRIVQEALALYPNPNSDPVGDSLYGEETIQLKMDFITSRFKLNTFERTNQNIDTLYPKFQSNLKRIMDTSQNLKIKKMDTEDFRLRDRILEKYQDRESMQKNDFMLETTPFRLKRFDEWSHIVETNPGLFMGEKQGNWNEDRQMIEQSRIWKSRFNDKSKIFEDLKETEVVLTNLASGFKLFDLITLLTRKSINPEIVKTKFDIFGELCSIRLNFQNKLQYNKLFSQLKHISNGDNKLSVVTKENQLDQRQENRTVVFLNLATDICDKEFITKLASKCNITHYSCPKIRSNGRLPKTSKLIQDLKTIRNSELDDHNVVIMEFGPKGWKQLRFDGHKQFSELDFEQFMWDSSEMLTEEAENYKYQVSKNFQKYFSFLKKEINRKTYFSIEDSLDMTAQVNESEFQNELEFYDQSPFADENQFLKGLKLNTEGNDTKNQTDSSEDSSSSEEVVKLIFKNEKDPKIRQQMEKNLSDIISPFVNCLESNDVEKLKEDLMTKTNDFFAKTSQKIFKSRQFSNDVLQKQDAHKGFIVVQFASRKEAKKALFYAKHDIDKNLEMFLLNDLSLYHLDPDYKTKKLQDISNMNRHGDTFREEMAKELRANIEKIRRKEYVNRDHGEKTVNKDHISYRLGTEDKNLSNLKINEYSPIERVNSISRNRIKDRDVIRKEFRELFDKMSFFCLNDGSNFTYNLAGLEKIQSKMAERGRKLNGLMDASVDNQINFEEELSLLKERRENYLNDSDNGTQEKRQQLRSQIQSVQNKMTQFHYGDVQEELDGVLSEYGLNELQRQSFEEMMLVQKDLKDLLDGSLDAPTKVFKKIQHSKNIKRDANRLLDAIDRKSFGENFDILKAEFLHGIREKEEMRFESELSKFEKDLQKIYFGTILEIPEIQTFLRKNFEEYKKNEFETFVDFLHIYDIDQQLFLDKAELPELCLELYGKEHWSEREREIIRSQEFERVRRERYENKTLQNLRLGQRVEEFKLRDGVAVGMLKLKKEVQTNQDELDELVELLNYNDLDYEYIPQKSDINELFLIKKTRGFKFNVAKYLKFREEYEDLVSKRCAKVNVFFEDFLRMERGLNCSSVNTQRKIQKEVIENEEFQAEVEVLEEEFFSNEEKIALDRFSFEEIEEEILKFKSHLLFKKKFVNLEMDDFVRAVRKDEIVSPLTGKISHPSYDLVVDN